jgi:cell division protein DivIC
LSYDFGIHRNYCTLSLMNDQYYRKDKQRQSIVDMLKKKWKNKNLRLTLLIVVPVFCFITFGNKGIIQRFRLESQKQVIEEKIRQAQQEHQKFLEQSKALDNDPKAIEKVAREKYGMIREGENVYKVKKEK